MSAKAHPLVEPEGLISASRLDSATSATGPGRPNSLVQQVVDGIIQGVAKGAFVPGQRLVAADLAETFEVSRAPVREALAVLAGEGVVDLIPNRGAKIRKLSIQELCHFLEFTEAICCLGIRGAMRVIHKAPERATLCEAFAAMEKHWTDRSAPEFINSIYEYHETLNTLSGNTFLDFFYRRPYFVFYNRLLADLIPGSTENWERYFRSYSKVHETILRGEVERAEAAFISHISWVLDIMRENAAQSQ